MACDHVVWPTATAASGNQGVAGAVSDQHFRRGCGSYCGAVAASRARYFPAMTHVVALLRPEESET